MRALSFGTYDREHPRNVNAIAAMSAAGVEVTERQIPIRGGGLRTTIAARGHRVYAGHASRRVLGERWRRALGDAGAQRSTAD